ncbi:MULTISPECIES: hypothetical protein [unclassified Endozoicomonas]|uniref:hypothetical protein n=1 Tax=unclassified Endozoicomonas TaxID=2644528 RepID=UPI0021499626|nr:MULTISPECIES: hypothetical protein [unclassified Endozoicomonas]
MRFIPAAQIIQTFSLIQQMPEEAVTRGVTEVHNASLRTTFLSHIVHSGSSRNDIAVGLLVFFHPDRAYTQPQAISPDALFCNSA